MNQPVPVSRSGLSETRCSRPPPQLRVTSAATSVITRATAGLVRRRASCNDSSAAGRLIGVRRATRRANHASTACIGRIIPTKGRLQSVLTTRRLHVLLATRGLGILTARGLGVLPARSLSVLAARRLHVLLATRSLSVLTARGLSVLTTRRLHVLLATRGLSVLATR